MYRFSLLTSVKLYIVHCNLKKGAVTSFPSGNTLSVKPSGGEGPTLCTQRTARITQFTGDPFFVPGREFNFVGSSPSGCYPKAALAEESTQERAPRGAP